MFTGDRSGSLHHPGQTVERSGVYRVVHSRHRMPHEVTMIEGEKFPRCRKCEVRYELVHGAERFGADVDLVALLIASAAVMTSVAFLPIIV